jgi:hypothetical protein
LHDISQQDLVNITNQISQKVKSVQKNVQKYKDKVVRSEIHFEPLDSKSFGNLTVKETIAETKQTDETTSSLINHNVCNLIYISNIYLLNIGAVYYYFFI